FSVDCGRVSYDPRASLFDPDHRRRPGRSRDPARDRRAAGLPHSDGREWGRSAGPGPRQRGPSRPDGYAFTPAVGAGDPGAGPPNQGWHSGDPDHSRPGRQPDAPGAFRACVLCAGQTGEQAHRHLRRPQGDREVLQLAVTGPVLSGRRNVLAWVALGLAWAGCSPIPAAWSHDIPNQRVDRSIQVTVAPGRLAIDY